MKQGTFIAKPHGSSVDVEYKKWLTILKDRFKRAQIKAAVKVNSELLLFYWELGRDLVTKKAEEKWGSGIVERLSIDLRKEFPNVKGFSFTNLRYTKRWYLFYANSNENCVLLEDLEKNFDGASEKNHQLGDEFEAENENNRSDANFLVNEKNHQLGDEFDFPSIFGYVPWRHHVEIITKCQSVEEALFYITRVVDEGWSRKTLIHNIEGNLYIHAGAAITNFEETMPYGQSKLAQAMLKDSYDLSFIALPPGYSEEDLEEVLEQNITDFLLELGTGFSFIGRQKEIVVAGKSRKIDMLFYQIRFKCYVVVELKVIPFEPEFAGKLNFYVNAVDHLIKTNDENPTIGLLICKVADRTEVQWSLQGIHTPIGVAAFKGIKKEEFRAVFPTEEQIQRRLDQAEKEYRASLLQKG